MPKVVSPKHLPLGSAYGGSDTLKELTDIAIMFGLYLEPISETHVQLKNITDYALLTKEKVEEVTAIGCVVHDYVVYFKVSDPTQTIPASFDEGSVAWQDWAGSQRIITHNGFVYRRNSSAADSGEILTSDKWASMVSTPPPGVEVITEAQFISETADNPTP